MSLQNCSERNPRREEIWWTGSTGTRTESTFTSRDIPDGFIMYVFGLVYKTKTSYCYRKQIYRYLFTYPHKYSCMNHLCSIVLTGSQIYISMLIWSQHTHKLHCHTHYTVIQTTVTTMSYILHCQTLHTHTTLYFQTLWVSVTSGYLSVCWCSAGMRLNSGLPIMGWLIG